MKINKNIQIAIDGPVGAGKSTVAYLLAQKLNILYIDTGSMYRAVALLAIINNLDFYNEADIMAILKKSTIKLLPPFKKSRFCTVLLNNKNVTKKIRTQKVSWGSSAVAVLPQVRKHLVKLQKRIAKAQSVVMEGRDITTVVLPQADLKIYMTASVEARAKRRHKELQKKGIKQTFSATLKETKKRDRQDSNRETDPLTVTQEVWLLKTSNLTINQVITAIIKRLIKLDFLEKSDIIKTLNE